MNKSFKSSTRNTLISGKNTYRDTHGNLIYYDQHNNMAYRIPSAKENTFATFQSRYALAVICFVFLYILFSLNIFLSIAISIAVAIFMEWRYRTFLKNTVHSTGFIKKDKIRSIVETIDLTQGAIILRIVLYGALAVLLVVNTFVSDNVIGNKPIIVISYMVAVLAGFMAIKYVQMAIRKAGK